MPLYQLLLLLFPAAFRAEYGGEMSAVFRARRRDENPLVLWPSTILDVIANAARVHWDMLRQDLAWTFRILGQAPGFTITAVAVAALGIGANTAAFTLLDHVLLRPLPFVHPERLATLYQSDHKNGYSRVELSPLNYRDWKSASKSFEALPAYRGLTVNLSGIGEPERLDGASMSADMLRTLGVHPSLGRGFTASDDQAGAPGTVLLSDSLWRSLFGADPDVVGRRMRLDDQLYTVVGVMPASFSFPNREVELWTPLRLVPPDFQDRTNCFLHVIGRLRPGVTLDQARSELNVITASLEKAYPKDNYGIGATVLDMRDVVSSQSRMLVIAVFGAAFCVMLIACMNLANLLLTRATTRRREIAVRIAIGASRERLVRQLFTENLVLALAGGALGLLLASVAMPSLALLVPDALPIGGAPKVDLRVFCFAGALTIVTTLLFGVGPAARACSQPDMNSLRGRSEAGGRAARLRTALVLAEVVGTVTLLVGAGLLVKALWRIQGVDPGFRPNGVLTMRTVLPMPKYDPTSRRTQFYTHVLTEARALPGVTSAAYVSFLPMVMRGGIWPVGIAGLNDDPATRPKVSLRYATPDFFRTLQIPIIEGRDIGDRDTIDAPFVAVVSQSFGKRYLPGLEPLGRKVNIAFADRTIVGVVADIAVRGLENRSEPQVYLSARQVLDGWVSWYAPKDLVIRTTGNPLALAPQVRRIIHDADPQQPVSDVRPLDEIVSAETASRKVQINVLGAFAAIAFLLAAVGIHGLVSFAVSIRTPEVGVRLALGARPRDIINMFLKQGLVVGVLGVAVAVPLAYLAARGMGSLLFGVQPGDPVIYVAAGVLALAMTIGGSFRPAMRAASVDPAITIRTE